MLNEYRYLLEKPHYWGKIKTETCTEAVILFQVPPFEVLQALEAIAGFTPISEHDNLFPECTKGWIYIGEDTDVNSDNIVWTSPYADGIVAIGTGEPPAGAKTYFFRLIDGVDYTD